MEEDVQVLSVKDFNDFKNIKPSEEKEGYINPVCEYTREGVYVKTWKNPVVVAKAFNVSTSLIINCCKGYPLISYKCNRIFLYKGTNINKRLKAIKQYEISDNPTRPVDVYTLDGEFIRTYSSMTAAGKNKIGNCYIKECCLAKRLFIKDKIYLFKGSSISDRLKLIKKKEELDNLIEQEVLKH